MPNLRFHAVLVCTSQDLVLKKILEILIPRILVQYAPHYVHFNLCTAVSNVRVLLKGHHAHCLHA